MTRDTVLTDTPQYFATSLMVIESPLLLPCADGRLPDVSVPPTAWTLQTSLAIYPLFWKRYQ